LSEADYLGPRAIVEGNFKLVIHEENKKGNSPAGAAKQELFDLQADPAEKTHLMEQKPDVAKELQGEMRRWQDSVLHSLTGSDYKK
jgi:arylsulfatase A-like enzyme